MKSAASLADFHLTAARFTQAEPGRPIVRVVVGVYAGVMLVAAACIWLRRGMGAVSTPLPSAALIGVGGAVAVAALASRYAWRSTGVSRSARVALSCLITISALGFAAATSLPGSASLGLVGLWVIVVSEELCGWWLCWPASPNREPVPREAPRSVAVAQGFEQALLADSSPGLAVPQERVTQQVTRLLEPDGTERVVGWMRVCFEQGQRLASVHLAFCPPFTRTPEAALERFEGPQVRIKRIQVFPFGARFDLKLDSPAERRLDLLLRVAAEAQGEPNSPPAAATSSGHDIASGDD